MSEQNKELSALKESGSPAAQRKEDWLKWRMSNHGIPLTTPIHALGLHRDPSRGRSHVLWYTARYTPNAGKDAAKKFTISSISIFKLDDVLTHIEVLLCLEPGEGKPYVVGLLDGHSFHGNKDPGSYPYTLFVTVLDGERETFLGTCE